MKCPKCGTTNGKTNKFCRACGSKLEEALIQEPVQVAKPCVDDEVALGEELFIVWQCYTSGDLNTALTKAEKIISCNPESASAHSILGLIYERKAEKEIKSGEIDTAHDFLKLAIAQYEKIIDLNPKSAADREKLASLRAILAGNKSIPSAPVQVKSWSDLKFAIRALPTPALIGAGTFIVIIMFAIIFIPTGKKEQSIKINRQDDRARAKINLLTTAGEPQAYSASTNNRGSAPLKIYTFPEAPHQSASYSPQAPAPPASSNKLDLSIEPLKLPAMSNAEVTVLPVSKPSKKAEAAQSKQEKNKQKEPDKGQITIAPAQPAAPQAADGSTVLAHAIDLHDQGKTQEAISAAQQAMDLYQADIAAGKNSVSARRGSENAKKLIQLWQQ